MGSQCYLPPDRGDIPAFTPVEAVTRFSDPGGMQGWVDLVGWLHTMMVYPPKAVTHPSTNQARRRVTSFMWRMTLATTPHRHKLLRILSCTNIATRLRSLPHQYKVFAHLRAGRHSPGSCRTWHLEQAFCKRDIITRTSFLFRILTVATFPHVCKLCFIRVWFYDLAISLPISLTQLNRELRVRRCLTLSPHISFSPLPKATHIKYQSLLVFHIQCAAAEIRRGKKKIDR